jgi:ATP synthase protein I
MNNQDGRKFSSDGRQLGRKIRKSEERLLKRRKQGVESIWSGFAVFGLIGWSVVIPTLSGVMLGLWIDGSYPSKHSWTLTLLVTGLFFGCLNAWRWISEENRNMHKRD